MLLLASPLYASEYKDGSLFAFSDVLVWRVREGSADNWAQNITPTTAQYRPVTLYDAPFNWNAGFRLGLGFKNAGDPWDAVLYLTRFQTKASNHVTGQIYSAYIGNFYINNTDGVHYGPYYSNASLQWNFLFYTLDAELGQTFEVSNVVKLRPFIGLKSAIINQTIETNWNNPLNATNFSTAAENLAQNFWGIGPAIGLDTTWPLFKGDHNAVSLFGNFSGALLFGHWGFKDRYSNNAPIVVTLKTDDINGATSMARALVGVAWSTQLAKTDLTVRLGYEAQVWFSQMQYYSFNMGKLNHLMSLQGGVLDFSLKL